MIPIRSPEGRVIAFGGAAARGRRRAEVPQLARSPGSTTSRRSSTRVDQARDEIRKKKSAVLCEGYFDAIGLHQAGVKNAVALCSTALTPGHLALLHRLEAKELVLLLDGDEAGRKAVERLAPDDARGRRGPRGSRCCPEGEDPDTFARKVGTEGVQKLVQEAKPLTEHLFQHRPARRGGGELRSQDGRPRAAAPDRGAVTGGPHALGLLREPVASTSGSRPRSSRSTLRGKASEQLQGRAQARRPVPASRRRPFEARPCGAPSSCAIAACWQKDELPGGAGAQAHRAAAAVEGVATGQAPEDALYDTSEIAQERPRSRRGTSFPRTKRPLEQAFLEVCLRLKLQAVEEHLKRITREISQVARCG